MVSKGKTITAWKVTGPGLEPRPFWNCTIELSGPPGYRNVTGFPIPSKTSNNNNILAQDIDNKIRWTLEIRSFQEWEDFEKNEFLPTCFIVKAYPRDWIDRPSVRSIISSFRLTVWIARSHRGKTHIINESRFSCEKYGWVFHRQNPFVFCMSWWTW